MRCALSLDSLRFSGDALVSPDAIGGLAGFSGRLYSVPRFEVVFVRDENSDEGVDLGASLSADLLLKRDSGTNKYDAAPLTSATSWTRGYDSVEPLGTVTASATSDALTLSAHGLQNGDVVVLSTTGTAPVGITAGTLYYVRDATTATFRVATTKGGSAVDITDASAGSTHSIAKVSRFYYYSTISLSEPVFEKLLGVDDRTQKEVVALQCVADVSGSLRGKYFDLYTSSSAYLRVWFYVGGSGSSPAAGTGGTLVQISISSGATANTIATAIGADAAVTAAYTSSVSTDTITLTAASTGARGWHTPGDTGFTLTVTAAGMSLGGTTDVDSVDVLAEFSWEDPETGELQIAEMVKFIVENTLRRETQGVPAATGGSNVRTGVADISNAASSVSVTFSTALPDASYKLTSAQVVNTTDGTPLSLSVGTLTARSATGFTVLLSGAADSANYDLEYTVTR